MASSPPARRQGRLTGGNPRPNSPRARDAVGDQSQLAGCGRLCFQRLRANPPRIPLRWSGEPDVTEREIFSHITVSALLLTAIALAATPFSSAAHAFLTRSVIDTSGALYQGRRAEAPADAALVEPGFVIVASADASSGRRQNGAPAQNNSGASVSVASRYRGLTATRSSAASIPDPRVPVIDAGPKGADNVTQLFRQTKYTSADSGIPNRQLH